jgi:hypothetical protein
MKYYDLILPHVVKNIAPLNLDKMLVYEKSWNLMNIITFSRILSEIVRLHPSHDYSAIVGLLTALIEWLLNINWSNTYKIKIKICNLMRDSNLSDALNEIYKSRSSFFHTWKYASIKDIYRLISIEFLLVVIRNIINYWVSNEISNNTLDFSL